jgi:hypothetical protein
VAWCDNVLFFIHIGNRRVFVSGVTAASCAAWVAQQARNGSMEMAEWGLPGRFLLLDHDAKFTRDFAAVFEAEGTEVKRVGPVAPNLNAYAERWVQTLPTECLDHFLILGENHLRHVLKGVPRALQPGATTSSTGERPAARGGRAGAARLTVPDRRGEVPRAARRAAPPLPPPGRLK